MDRSTKTGNDSVLFMLSKPCKEGVMVKLNGLKDGEPVLPVASLLRTGAVGNSVEAGKFCIHIIICKARTSGSRNITKPSGI
jgi:hypothetical protein